MSTTNINSAEQITKTNQRLFDKYASVFTSPESTEDFVVHAQKLADWLSDFKAYYHAARPQIVKLLLTAHKTICTSLNVAPTSFHVSQYPHDVKVQAYANLVRTVEPFKNYFQQHPGSFAHIQFLMSTIQSPPHPFVIPNQSTAAVNQQHLNSGPSNSGIPAPTPIEHDPEVVIIDKPPNFQDRPAKKDAQSVPGPTMNPNATVKSTRPKVKKRKTIDFNLLVEEDIKGLQEKKAALPSGLQPDEGNAMDSAFSTSTMQDALVSVQGPEPTTTTLVDDIDRKEDQLTRFDPTSVVSQPLSSELQLLPEPQLFSDSQPLPEPEPLPGSQPLPDSQSLPDSLEPQLQPQNLRESQHPPEPQPLPKPQLPLEIQHPLESHQPLESYPPSEPCPPSKSHLPLESHPPSELLHSESPPVSEKFGPSIHIVARQDGLAYQGRMTVCFNVSDSTYAKISNWVKVNRDPNEIIPINSCICFSFGCYLTSDLKKNPDDTALENQVRSTSTTWPPAGSLSMKVQFKGSEESIPLSPPIKVTPNALVDMCPFIICGENSIDIAQKEDLSQYTFVLYVHWPSAEQLAQVRQNRKKEQDWKKWMLEVTRPLKVPSVDYRQAV